MEDFPWPHFASLAMHNLINLWELQPAVSRVISEEITNKTPQKVNILFFINYIFVGLTLKNCLGCWYEKVS